ncbi:hypothetical protein ACFX12_031198 [Malus domestica]
MRRLLVVGDMNHRFRAVAAGHAVVGETMKDVRVFGFKSRSVVLRGLFWGEGELQALGLRRAGNEPMVPGFWARRKLPAWQHMGDNRSPKRLNYTCTG